MQTSYKINGIPIKRPDDFRIERYNVTSLQRIASGEMCGDLIAKKRTFQFTYNSITSDAWDHILNIIWETTSLFFPFTYVENNVEKTVQVYTGALPSDFVRSGAKWVWKNVQFSLIEK